MVIIGAILATAAHAQPRASEAEVKATFLFNFCHFVEWPQAALEPTNALFVIGILGSDPFGSFLDDLARNEQVAGKPIVVKRFRTAHDALGAHVLFVGRSEEPRFKTILETLGNKPILTVGNGWSYPGFARRGGMIGMYTERGKVRLRVNVNVAKAAGLSVSSKLLRIAEVVGTETSSYTGSPDGKPDQLFATVSEPRR